jgi:hypothetical protein
LLIRNVNVFSSFLSSKAKCGSGLDKKTPGFQLHEPDLQHHVKKQKIRYSCCVSVGFYILIYSHSILIFFKYSA